MIYKRGLFSGILTAARDTLRKFDSDLIRSLFEHDDNMSSILDKGISFDENFDSVYVTFTTNGTPGTEVTVAHDLGRTPTGYIPVSKDKSADIYNTTASDKDNLYLKSDVASAVITLIVF